MDANDQKEVRQATKALRDWFRSQDIGPAEGFIVMAHLMSETTIAGIDVNKPEESLVKIAFLPKIIAEVVRVQSRFLLSKILTERMDTVKNPELKKIIEEALKGVKK